MNESNCTLEIYDEEYQRQYEERADTDLGRKIYDERWRFVCSYVPGGTLLDYGCATGAFHNRAPDGFLAKGYDVNPYSPYRELPERTYTLTMWDVMEHLIVPTEPLERLQPTWVFLSTPNIEAMMGDVRNWKHFKPGEHLHYFSRKSLEAVLACAGYRVLSHNFGEGQLRDPENPDAIISVVAKRV